MGIPSFFSHLVKDHPNCVKEINQNNIIDNLYLDSNSIIYDCVHKIANEYSDDSSFEKQLIVNVLKKIIEYITTLSPKKRCMIAFDGVAPVAKLKQQRNRRYKSMIDAMVDTKLLGYENKTWNTSAITPGTNFMQTLMDYLRYNLKTGEFKDIIISRS